MSTECVNPARVLGGNRERLIDARAATMVGHSALHCEDSDLNLFEH